MHRNSRLYSYIWERSGPISTAFASNNVDCYWFQHITSTTELPLDVQLSLSKGYGKVTWGRDVAMYVVQNLYSWASWILDAKKHVIIVIIILTICS